MIDWFASKLGVVVFVIAAAAVLLAFANTQIGILEGSASTQALNTLVNVLDKACEGCSTTLSFDREHRFIISGQTASIGPASRQFYASVAPADVTASGLKVYRTGGTVHVEKA